ncbi:MAG: lysine--tRNA ligase [Christensenellaceae bacterium]|nr:lysine--tRNA ligase [Christensenellaceae bacterium]
MENQVNVGSEIEVRTTKIKELKEQGINPYAPKFEPTVSIKEARESEDGKKVKVAGRIVSRRIMGKLSFMQIQDVFAKVQISVGRNEISEQDFDFYKKMIDIGDHIGIEGEVYTTHTGEKTVRALKFQLLSKAMRPLPEKFHGLTDSDIRYRQRYLDLISNENTRKVLLGRTRFLSYLRRFLTDENFIEVETPILQSAVCGAAAKPFYTKHNALDKVCNLRIAPEVYLKQVIAGGFNRVFEVAKVFRNEGMDTQHLQEFTMCEWYAAYFNFEDNIELFTRFVQGFIKEEFGDLKIPYHGQILDFSGKKIRKIDYTAEVNKTCGFDVLEVSSRDELVKKLIANKVLDKSEFVPIKTMGGVIDLVYKRKIRPSIFQPAFLYNYPTCLVPLARENDEDHRRIEMFQFLVDGIELCKAYSELVDPVLQREKLEDQAKHRAEGDDEAQDLDEDFLLAMEHGMPPISGLGIGIDRFVQVVYDQESIRDTVLFPLMK